MSLLRLTPNGNLSSCNTFGLTRACPLFRFATDYFGAHLIRPLLHDPSERFFSLCRPGLSVERDLSQFEAPKKVVLTEAEGRKPCGERFLAHSGRGFCVQHRHTGFLIAKASRVFRSL
jgi:hypothetical protein